MYNNLRERVEIVGQYFDISTDTVDGKFLLVQKLMDLTMGEVEQNEFAMDTLSMLQDIIDEVYAEVRPLTKVEAIEVGLEERYLFDRDNF